MSQSITIPSDKGNPVNVTINGMKYTYTAGETATVPDEVAALFAANDDQNVIYGRRTTSPLEPATRYTGSNGVPVSVGDNGALYADPVASVSAINVDGSKLVIPTEED